MNKLFVIGVLGLLLVGGVYAFSITSEPISKENVVIRQNTKPETRPCSNDEWNSYFEDYRNGIVNRVDTKKLLK